MFEEGSIIYFTPFYFQNGNKSKPKYFIVLKNIGNKILCANLPTSQDHIPSDVPKEFGCINDKSRNLNCFFIPKNKIITENNWFFDLDTYLYGEELGTYEVDKLNDLYTKVDIDYQLIGKLTKNSFNDLICCFTRDDNTNTKNKFKKMLLK